MVQRNLLSWKDFFIVTIIESRDKKVSESRLVIYSFNGFQSRDFASKRGLEKLSIMMIIDRKNMACHWPNNLVLSPFDRFLLCVLFSLSSHSIFSFIWRKVILSLSKNNYQCSVNIKNKKSQFWGVNWIFIYMNNARIIWSALR